MHSEDKIKKFLKRIIDRSSKDVAKEIVESRRKAEMTKFIGNVLENALK